MSVDQNLLNAVLRAEHRIRPHILETPLLYSPWLSKQNEGDVYLKLENEQYTGSFKARGSLNKLMALQEEKPGQEAITASTGNHGRGFARGLDLLGMEGKIVLPHNAVSSKVEALKQFDVELEFHGEDSYAAERYAKSMADKQEMAWVSPYNDTEVIGGQGTIGVELMRQHRDINDVLITVGGGGLISGIATYLKSIDEDINIVGCQPENSPEMARSVEAGKYVDCESLPTLSDGSAGGFEPDSITFDVCRQLVDRFILADEDEIADGIRTILKRHSKVIEGAAGVAVASFLKEVQRFKGRTVVIVLCGANIPPEKLGELLGY